MSDLRALISPNRPWIHLLYLGLFFFAWIYRPPTLFEAGLALAVMAGFIAVYVYVMRRMDWTIYPAALIATMLGLLFLPHTMGGGVYLVFAAAMLGRLPFNRTVWLAMICLAIASATGVWMFAPTPLLVPVALGLGTVAAAGSAFARRNEYQASIAEQAQARAAHAAAEAERQRIARDLHDLLGQTLSVVTLKAEIAERLLDGDRDRARAELQAIQSVSRDALAEVREAVIGLRGRSLADALGDAGQRLRDGGVEVHIQGADLAEFLPADVSTALAMVTREAVTNILRHAAAQTAWLSFEAEGQRVCLRIADNGCGGADPSGGGLSGLRDRMAAIGGQILIDPTGNRTGSCVEARLTLNEGGDD